MRFARVVNGVVVQTLNVPPIQIYDQYTAALFTECPDQVEVDWTYDGTTWAAPVPPPLTVFDLTYELYLYQQEKAAAQRLATVNGIIQTHGMPASREAFRTILDGMLP